MIAFLIPTSNCIKRWKQAKKICSLTGNLKIDASEIFELESERKANWNQVQCLLFIFAPQYLLSKLMFEWEICFSLTQKAEERKVKAPAEGVGLNSSKAAAVFFESMRIDDQLKYSKLDSDENFYFVEGHRSPLASRHWLIAAVKSCAEKSGSVTWETSFVKYFCTILSARPSPDQIEARND